MEGEPESGEVNERAVMKLIFCDSRCESSI
jgi:hypothetical protein